MNDLARIVNLPLLSKTNSPLIDIFNVKQLGMDILERLVVGIPYESVYHMTEPNEFREYADFLRLFFGNIPMFVRGSALERGIANANDIDLPYS
jgi:hypothetical protein